MLNNINEKVKEVFNFKNKNTKKRILDNNLSIKSLDVGYEIFKSCDKGPTISPIGNDLSLIKHFTEYSYKIKLKGNDIDKFIESLLLDILKEININEPKNEFIKMSIPYLKRILENMRYKDSNEAAEVMNYLIDKYVFKRMFISDFTEYRMKFIVSDIERYLRSFDLNHPNDLLLGEMNLNCLVQHKLERCGIYTLSVLQKFVKGERTYTMIAKDSSEQHNFIEKQNEYYNTLKNREAIILDLDNEQRKYLQLVLDSYKDSKNTSIRASLI